eukprot:TRINITY_DN81726_c0_g1_i1.p1 TRINITY_DN81726_c0_g1~~TRINITY_DN81726_c0_g1_i1.p1  ORF type:complete len:358 (+),score=72.78 TRINITY_DN81726_c0_g1_i1:60-1133(+)
MGPRLGKRLPPVSETDLRVLLSYNLSESHIYELFNKFVEVDVNLNGFWTVNELYKLISDSRISIRAPIIDRLFFMGDGRGEGSMSFGDFVVSLTSFCALSREEVLQLLFCVVDEDRNGLIEKDELIHFFSFMPKGDVAGECKPVYPVNNKNALDTYRHGKWTALDFDGMAQLCELFPYISYPAYHVQEMIRKKLLGPAFWEKLDMDRMVIHGRTRKFRRVQLPHSKEKILVTPPGRVTMQEFLEYSRRKTKVQDGKRVADDDGEDAGSGLTSERDRAIAMMPLSNMIRNPRCMYYVPAIANQGKKKKEKDGLKSIEDAGPTPTGVVQVKKAAAEACEYNSETSSEAETENESEYSER